MPVGSGRVRTGLPARGGRPVLTPTRRVSSAAGTRAPAAQRMAWHLLGADVAGNTGEEADMSEQARDRVAFLRRLRTVRDRTSDPVPEAALRDVLDVGRWTGTANNRQSAEFIVVRDPA